jgi:ABC-type transport system substrate-binding protein
VPTNAPTVPIATASSTELVLTILTVDDPDLLAIAETLKRQWSLLGVRVMIDPQPTDVVMRRATRERTAQIVLLNIFLGPEQNILPFWWSGQAVDRGLNFSNLSNRAVDDALEGVRMATSTQTMDTARNAVTQAITQQFPGAFLIRPIRHYLVDDMFHGISDRLILANPSERFQDIVHWYTKTGWRWK